MIQTREVFCVIEASSYLFYPFFLFSPLRSLVWCNHLILLSKLLNLIIENLNKCPTSGLLDLLLPLPGTLFPLVSAC